MKYEITKGSEKDFDGAPEWATECVWNDKGSESFCYWLNPKTKTIFNPNWHIKPDCWNEEYGWRNYIKAERRPITEPVWSGEGLPPVGVECEIKRVADWFPVTIKFISGYYTVILTRGGTEDAFQTSALQFRPIPIRSPEDVARDEGKEVIAKSLRSSKDYDEAAGVIYEAIAAGRIKGLIKEPSTADLKIQITTDEMWREFEKKSDMEDVYKLITKRMGEKLCGF